MKGKLWPNSACTKIYNELDFVNIKNDSYGYAMLWLWFWNQIMLLHDTPSNVLRSDDARFMRKLSKLS